MREHKTEENETFSKTLIEMLEAQYEKYREQSVAYEVKKAELDASLEAFKNGGTRATRGREKQCYIDICTAYPFDDFDDAEEAEDYNANDVKEYLTVVFRILAEDAKKDNNDQIWLHSEKGECKFLKLLREWMNAFLPEDELGGKDDKSLKKLLCDEKTLTKHIECGCEPDNEVKVIKDLHGEMVRRCVFSYTENFFKNDNSSIDKVCLDKCAANEYFAKLFSSESKASDENEVYEKNFSLFYTMIKNGENTGKPGSELYRNVLIPLYVDGFTGVSLCIVGRNYFYDRKSFHPCTLMVMHLSDVGEKLSNGMTSIYEPDGTFDESVGYLSGSEKLNETVCRNYFERVYLDYRRAVMEARFMLRDIDMDGLGNRFSKEKDVLPEELMNSGFYRELSQIKRKVEKNRPDAARKRNELIKSSNPILDEEKEKFKS